MTRYIEPTALIFGARCDERSQIGAVCAEFSLQSADASTLDYFLVEVHRLPRMIVVAVGVDDHDALYAIKLVRSVTGVAFTPAIRIGESIEQDALFDRYVSPMHPADDLRRAFADLRPPPNPVLSRLIDTFGRQEMAGLALSLRQTLVDALGRPMDTATAHQIAGLAGTLGYRLLCDELNEIATGEIIKPYLDRSLRATINDISQTFAGVVD